MAAPHHPTEPTMTAANDLIDAIRAARDDIERKRRYESNTYHTTSMDDWRDRAERMMEVYGAIITTLDTIIDAAAGSIEEED